MDHSMDEHHTHNGGMAGHQGMGMNCDGTPPLGEGGTLIGHVLPGCLFVLWGSWWAYNACLRCACSGPNRAMFRSSSWYKMPGRWSLVEPVLKIVLPLVALSMELYFDHMSEGFQYMYCPKGTKHEGEFAGDNLNNWQHAASYPAVIVSGIVDLLSLVVEFPNGLTHAFTSLVFGIMSFLMLLHEKHEALDKAVHWLLAVAMGLAFLFIVLEMKAKNSAVVSMGKGVSTIFVGAWLIQIGRYMYTDMPEWTKSKGLGAMMAPVFFCMTFLLICVCVTGLYVVLVLLVKMDLLPRSMRSTLPVMHTSLATTTGKQALELAERKRLLSTKNTFDNDSALCSSEGSPSQMHSLHIGNGYGHSRSSSDFNV